MPKKFKGENTKATAARERKQAAKQEADDRKQSALEDAYWKDDDKHAQRKQDRRADREKKRQEQLERKQEAKLLLAEEESKTVGKSAAKGGGGGGATKMTRAQITEAEEKRKRESEASAATALPKRVSIDVPTLELNPNREAQERRMAGELEARTVDEAIAVLSDGKEALEKHPERRVKAAYAAYEERELPRLKEENPNLRMSQLKQLLRKEWMKSPENPMNQHHVAFNTKT